jgi:hypothetical protein
VKKEIFKDATAGGGGVDEKAPALSGVTYQVEGFGVLLLDNSYAKPGDVVPVEKLDADRLAYYTQKRLVSMTTKPLRERVTKEAK